MDFIKNNGKKLILGSKSPRRSQLLSDAGFSFTNRYQDVDEDFNEDTPVLEVAEELATRKAKGLATSLVTGEILITADSVVILDGIIYNKPEDFEDGKRIIRLLSGRKHTVVTGVCLTSTEKQVSFSNITQIDFDELSDEEIEYYLNEYKPYDKAGAYGIQDWIGLSKIKSIEGSYTNVMGLPTQALYNALKEFIS